MMEIKRKMTTNTHLVGTGSQRFNNGKVRMSYIPPSIINNTLALKAHAPVFGLVKLAEHFSLGAVKYPNHKTEDGHEFPNWAKGQYFDSMLINSALRHAYAYEFGEIYDNDFNSHHLIATAWGLAALHHQFTHYDLYQAFDDRMWVGFDTENASKWSDSEFGIKQRIGKDTEDVNYHSPISVLHTIQTLHIDKKHTILTSITKCFINCLEIVELDLCHNRSTIDFKIDEDRLKELQSKDYGVPTTATK